MPKRACVSKAEIESHAREAVVQGLCRTLKEARAQAREALGPSDAQSPRGSKQSRKQDKMKAAAEAAAEAAKLPARQAVASKDDEVASKRKASKDGEVASKASKASIGGVGLLEQVQEQP